MIGVLELMMWWMGKPGKAPTLSSSLELGLYEITVIAVSLMESLL
jgi:hypothetical protein